VIYLHGNVRLTSRFLYECRLAVSNHTYTHARAMELLLKVWLSEVKVPNSKLSGFNGEDVATNRRRRK